MYDAGNQKSVFCENLEGWDGEGGGREVQEGGDMCVYIYTYGQFMWMHGRNITIL